jgi:hypothetical protein
VARADEHAAGSGKTLTREAEEPLGVRLDRVLQGAAVDLDRIGHAAGERAREDDGPHDQVVGERHVGLRALGDLAHGVHIGTQIVGQLCF